MPFNTDAGDDQGMWWMRAVLTRIDASTTCQMERTEWRVWRKSPCVGGEGRTNPRLFEKFVVTGLRVIGQFGWLIIRIK